MESPSMLNNLRTKSTDILPKAESTGLESPSPIETTNIPSYQTRERDTCQTDSPIRRRRCGNLMCVNRYVQLLHCARLCCAHCIVVLL